MHLSPLEKTQYRRKTSCQTKSLMDITNSSIWNTLMQGIDRHYIAQYCTAIYCTIIHYYKPYCTALYNIIGTGAITRPVLVFLYSLQSGSGLAKCDTGQTTTLNSFCRSTNNTMIVTSDISWKNECNIKTF